MAIPWLINGGDPNLLTGMILQVASLFPAQTGVLGELAKVYIRAVGHPREGTPFYDFYMCRFFFGDPWHGPTISQKIAIPKEILWNI